MDYLSSVGLEPQLAIPVVGVVVFAVLVYIFGFQKTEEPSYEHLAVLQSTYKPKSGSGLKQKSTSGVSQASKSANASKAKDKPIANGHVVQDKEKNGTVKKALNGLNKENKPPQNSKNTVTLKKEKKIAAAKPADFEEGDWIQAVSRKDKKNRVKKDDTKLSPRKENVPTPDADEAWDSVILKEIETSQVHNQTTQTTPLPSPEKKSNSSKATTTAKDSSSSSAEPSPKKQPNVANAAPAVVEKEDDAVEVQKIAVKESGKQESPKKSVEEPVVTEDPKSNVAFDEMAGTASDIWEEAKSRGTKKRRSRRD